MKIFVDASLDEKRGVAGIGLFVKRGASSRAISNWYKTDDVNEAELWGIYQASILGHGKDCTIYTDSMTALAYVNREVKDKPRTVEQYFRHKKMEWLACQIRRLKPKVEWVRGHCKYYQELPIGNNVADMMAKNGRAKYYAQEKTAR